jgi:hypothetical protein
MLGETNGNIHSHHSALLGALNGLHESLNHAAGLEREGAPRSGDDQDPAGSTSIQSGAGNGHR